MRSPQDSDETLLHAIVQRDVGALEALYDRHAQIMYNLIMRIVRDPSIADEVLQDTFWQAWQKANEFHGGGAVAAWLYRIARNKSLDHLRRQKVRPQVVLSSLLADEQTMVSTLTAPGPTVEQMAERTWKQHQVRIALGTIPVEQRVCLELAYFEGMTQREIAEHMTTPVGTVKTRMRMGLEKLERMLRSVGLGAEDIES